MSSLHRDVGASPCSEKLTTAHFIQLAFEQELDEFKKKMIAQLALAGKHEVRFRPAYESLSAHFELDAAAQFQNGVGSGFPRKPTAQPDPPPEGNMEKAEQPTEASKEECDAQSVQETPPPCEGSPRSQPSSFKFNASEASPDLEEAQGRARGSNKKSTKSIMSIPDMMEGALDMQLGMRKTRQWSDWFRPELTLETIHFLKAHPYRGKVRICVMHPFFDMFFGSVVLTSVAVMGIEIEVEAQTRQRGVETSFFFSMQVVCCALFVVEVVMRLLAFGRGFFGLGDGTFVRSWKWNTFDLFCTVSMIVDLADEFSYKERSESVRLGQGRILRFFRLMRIVRALRVLRMVDFARELRKMSYALQYSFHTLMWAMLLLSFVMYFFATAFTQATTEALSAAGDQNSHLSKLHQMYGSVGKSYFTLFQAITGGEDWHVFVDPLQWHTHWINTMLFVIYVAITVFGVMNVIMSVFVESALASVQHYKDLLIQENTKQKEVYIAHLKDVFAYMDYDHSGEISAAEMDRLLIDEDLKQYLESIEIHPNDARTLFRLLDKDNSGQVSIDEFCQGCLKLKGEAKSYDIHCIIYENQRMLHKWREYMAYLEKGFLPKLLNAVRAEFSGGQLKNDHASHRSSTQDQPSPQTRRRTQP